MPLQTTVIGSWPKPDYLKIPDWFRDGRRADRICADPRRLNNFTQDKESVERAIKEAVEIQEKLGIDVITDGEMRRENYVWHFCRDLKGFNFETPELIVYRNGATKAFLPVITGHITTKSGILYEEWVETNKLLNKAQLKYTLPGPLTITGTTKNNSELSREEIMKDLALCIKEEIRKLINAGCRNIQIDEPVLMREPEIALDYGLDILFSCLEGLELSNVTTTVHLCCGYPEFLDQENYVKADKTRYFDIAVKLDSSAFDIVSIEDKEAQNDLQLLGKFKRIKVALGSIAIARSRVESVEEIKKRVSQALRYIPKERLVLAPDCGLGHLTSKMAQQKLTNMVIAAHSF